MIVKLFDIQNEKVVLTEHCYALDFLKTIMDTYPDTYMPVYQYLFYMTCPDPEANPFFNLPEHRKRRYNNRRSRLRRIYRRSCNKTCFR